MPRSTAWVSLAAPSLSRAERANVVACIDSGWISFKGPFVTQFERRFAERVGARHGVAVSSGTSAILIALAALGVGAGDEVIVPAFTMIACVNTVVQLGARPVLVDSEPDTWNLDPDRVEAAITPRTRAILAVHLYGHPARMDRLKAVAERHGIALLEDAAEAHGATFRGAPVGSLADAGAFSFYANKLVACGEGGMVVTNRPEVADKARSLRNQCYDDRKRRWLVHEAIGYSCCMTNLQAGVGLAQTARLDTFIDRHRRNARRYAVLLADVPGVTLPPEVDWAMNVYWTYSVLIDADRFGRSRDELMLHLEASRIDCRTTFLPVHRQPPYRAMFAGARFPVAERLGETGISLPCGNTTTAEDVRRVASAVRSGALAGSDAPR